MVMDVRPLQSINVAVPILFTVLGMVTEVRPVREKAALPIVVTYSGIVTEVRLLQLLNILIVDNQSLTS